MEPPTILPDPPIENVGPIAAIFLERGVTTFAAACRTVHELPYGYNSDRDDMLTLFSENKGSCTTKHAVIATLAAELGLPVAKHIGIYAMTEELVTGTRAILERHRLPYLPMVHCFLGYRQHRIDLTEGNHNGKNGPIDAFLHTVAVAANIAEIEEYRLYRRTLQERVLPREEFRGVDLKTVLKARGEGIALLKAAVGHG